MANHKKARIESEIEEAKRLQQVQERLQLIFEADTLLPLSKTTDRSLEREFEKITLIGGSVISIKEIKDVISQQAQDYYVMFVKPFYEEIYRLNNWKGGLSHRPFIVAVWTNDIIYARFKKDVLPTLQTLNPYTELGIRNYKHFQWLNEHGQVLLGGYIQDAIRVMKTCTNWYEFRIKYAKEFGLPVQLRMWESKVNVQS